MKMSVFELTRSLTFGVCNFAIWSLARCFFTLSSASAFVNGGGCYLLIGMYLVDYTFYDYTSSFWILPKRKIRSGETHQPGAGLRNIPPSLLSCPMAAFCCCCPDPPPSEYITSAGGKLVAICICCGCICPCI